MGVRLGQTQQRMDTWMRLTPATRKSIHQTNESVIPPCRPLSDIIRLLACLMVALARSTVLMALLAYNPQRNTKTKDRQTNGDGETKDSKRKKPRQKEEKKQTKAHYFTDTNGNYEGSREKRWRVKRTEATTREGVVGCGQICCEGWFLLDLYFINYLRSRAHTPRTRIQKSLFRVHRSSPRQSQMIFNNPPPMASYNCVSYCQYTMDLL